MIKWREDAVVGGTGDGDGGLYPRKAHFVTQTEESPNARL